MNDRALDLKLPVEMARAFVRACDSVSAAADAVSAVMPILTWALVALAVALLVLAFRK